MKKILVINPGSTSTKVAVFKRNEKLAQFDILHDSDELQKYTHVIEQLDFRYTLIVNTLQKNGFNLSDFSIVMGRGGMLPPVKSGSYEVNREMINTLMKAERGEHASNLGAILADKITRKIGNNAKAYIADPVSVDEMDDVARISGMPEIPRQSIFHALNQIATVRHHAKQIGKSYRALNLVVAHIGGGVTVAAHRKGMVVDVNQGLNGSGPISPERCGTVEAGGLVNMCYSGKYTKQEVLKKIAGQGGLYAHLGSKDVKELSEKAEQGDKKVALVLTAMAYTIGKEIGAMLAVLHGECDGVILTGGVAHSTYITNHIKTMIESMAKVYIYAGEDEMASLAQNAVRIMDGETANVFE